MLSVSTAPYSTYAVFSFLGHAIVSKKTQKGVDGNEVEGKKVSHPLRILLRNFKKKFTHDTCHKMSFRKTTRPKSERTNLRSCVFSAET